MHGKIAGAVGLTGFMIVVGSAGALEMGGTVTTYLCLTAVGVVLISISMFWYEYQCIKAERRRNSLKHRRVRQNESDRGYR